jgi:putative sigma-54 modulation protein
MTVFIRKDGIMLSKLLRAHVERRLRFVLGRFGDRIGRVTVSLSDTGSASRCQIHVALRPKSVRVEDSDTTPRAAVNNAVQRLSRSLGRALEREDGRA